MQVVRMALKRVWSMRGCSSSFGCTTWKGLHPLYHLTFL